MLLYIASSPNAILSLLKILLFKIAQISIDFFLHRFKAAFGVNESVVVVGQHRHSQPDQFTVRVPVSEIIINQKFNRPGPTWLTSDIMLLKLAHPVEFNAAVSPVCLPTPFQVLPSGKRCYATGWGKLRSKYCAVLTSKDVNVSAIVVESNDRYSCMYAGLMI